MGSNGQKNVAGTELSFCFKMASSEGAEVMTIRIPKKSDELAQFLAKRGVGNNTLSIFKGKTMNFVLITTYNIKATMMRGIPTKGGKILNINLS